METSADYFRSDVPAGRSGRWVLEKVTLPDRQYDSAGDPRPDCFKFRPGTYSCLRRDGTQFMTDLYDEWWTQRSAIDRALAHGGNILITGLGLGLVAEAMLRPPDSPVEHVTIVEFSSDVVKLVGPYISARYPGKVDVINADAFEWKPKRGRRFTVGWHDIWPDPFGPVVEKETRVLEKRYKRYCEWQGFWPRDYIDALG